MIVLSTAILLFGSAVASDFTLHPTPLLTPTAGKYNANGVGSPSVAYIPNGGRRGEGGYVMVYETRLEAGWMATTFPANDYSLCREGEAWGLGIAVSDDGVNDWQMVTGQPLVVPEPGSFYACGAAHPKIVYEADAPGGPTLHIFFKAETGRSPEAPAGAPNRQTGVGLVQARLTGNWGSRSGWDVEVMDAPLLSLTTFGFPAVVRYGNTWYMWAAKVPSIYLATKVGDLPDLFATPTATTTFTLQPTPVMEPLATAWSPTRVFNPATICKDNAAYPFTMYVGGKGFDALGGLDSGGWGEAISADGTAWFSAALPQVYWASTADWRHWDALLVQPGAGGVDPGPASADYLVYYSINVDGKNQARFAYTSPSWNKAETRSKACTNALMDHDFAARPLNAPGNPEVYPAAGGFSDEELAAAGCAASGPVGLSALLAFPLLLLFSRRRPKRC